MLYLCPVSYLGWGAPISIHSGERDTYKYNAYVYVVHPWHLLSEDKIHPNITQQKSLEIDASIFPFSSPSPPLLPLLLPLLCHEPSMSLWLSGTHCIAQAGLTLTWVFVPLPSEPQEDRTEYTPSFPTHFLITCCVIYPSGQGYFRKQENMTFQGSYNQISPWTWGT